ncbi:MAG: adenine deaminase [Bacteroidetes bacterium]|nr:adenine deaminase [Bacteroidota bacterium]
MEKKGFSVSGNIVDVVGKRIFKGRILVENGIVKKITECDCKQDHYILPGLIDAHIHIESSMLIPSEFARLAVVHGTVATVSDPHEIANVLGVPGVRFMIENGRKVPFKFNFGASSCVPATSFETAGAKLGVKEIEELLSMKEVRYLSEMMNYPGVLYGDPEVMAKIKLAGKYGKPVDGHAPGLKGDDAARYIGAGITTDHECFSREEALDKIKCGMKILIREGSAARNFEELCSLVDEFPDMVMFCSDDKHPDDLVLGHINDIVKRALAKGLDLFNVLRACTYNPVKHYKLETGLVREGDYADFIVAGNLKDFNILETWVSGIKVAESGKTLISPVIETPFNNFNIGEVCPEGIRVKQQPGQIRVQEAYNGQLITGAIDVEPKLVDGYVVSDPGRDILKLIVKNRYFESPAGIGFICGLGLKRGAIASCVAHDSHNIVASGTDDESIIRAINLIIHSRGGISVVDGDTAEVLPLPFAGIMTVDDGYIVAEKYRKMDKMVKALGSQLLSPFMTLSFMALLVIPSLKLSDKGLFDGRNFAFTELFKI